MIKSRFPWDVRPCGHQLPVYRYQSVCRLQCLVFSGAHWVRCASYDPGIVKSGLVLSVGGTLLGLSRVPRRADCGEVFQELWIGQPSHGFVQCSACPRPAEPHERMHVHACFSPPSLLSNHLFQRKWCTRQTVRLCPITKPRHLGRPGLFARMFRTLGLLRQSMQ